MMGCWGDGKEANMATGHGGMEPESPIGRKDQEANPTGPCGTKAWWGCCEKSRRVKRESGAMGRKAHKEQEPKKAEGQKVQEDEKPQDRTTVGTRGAHGVSH